MLRFRFRLSIALSVVLLACDATPRFELDGTAPLDADRPVRDGGVDPDGAGETFAGVSIAGCAETLVTDTEYRCRGEIPLALVFNALAPPSATAFQWDPGDGSPAVVLPRAEHTYDVDGEYPVSLIVAGPFGTISPPHAIVVEAVLAGLGAWCEGPEHCAADLCLCTGADAALCPPALHGTCSAACSVQPMCPADGVCADLRVSAPVPPALPWRERLCYPACSDSADCSRAGHPCREVPHVDPFGQRDWTTACFPDVLADIGEPCPEPTGAPDPGLCLSGRCDPLGLFGVCTDSCASTPCPSYAVCVSFTGGPLVAEPVCIARCSNERPCSSDPALACELPDPTGDLGFDVLAAGDPPGTTYCAPRRCTDPVDCPAGVCTGGFCR